MKELQQKQKIKRRLYSTPGLIILTVLTLLAMRSAYEVIQKDKESAQYVSDLETKTSTLSDREAQLKTQIARLGTNDGVDTLIKEKFSVAGQGEHVAVIVDQPDSSTTTAPTESNWFQRLWQGFLDLW